MSVLASPVPVYASSAIPPMIGPSRLGQLSCAMSFARHEYPATRPKAAKTAVDAPMARCDDSSSTVLRILAALLDSKMASQAIPGPTSAPAIRPNRIPKPILPMRCRIPECNVKAVTDRHHSPLRIKTPSTRPAANQSRLKVASAASQATTEITMTYTTTPQMPF